MSRLRLPAALLVALAVGVAAPAHAELYYLIVGGLGGEATYTDQFAKDTDALATVAPSPLSTMTRFCEVVRRAKR